MKLNLYPKTLLFATGAIVLLSWPAQQSLAAGSMKSVYVSVKKDEDEKNNKAKKKTTRQTKAERKASPVKLAPDVFTSAVHVTAKDNSPEFDFYVFSVDGVLKAHHKMKAGDKKKIIGLEKGEYTYQVFVGDHERAFGTFEVKL